MELTKAQQQVIDTENMKMLVSASAGSGKTFVVTEKIIKSVVNDNIDIDSFLVLTFTNAAASELKERIKKGLYKGIENAKKNKDNVKAKFIHSQICKLQNANISTIHSFCLKIIKENFNYLNIDPLIKTLDEQKSYMLIIESLEEVIDTLYETEDENKKEIFLELLDIYGNENNLKDNILKAYYKYSGMLDKDEYFKNVKDMYCKLDESIGLEKLKFGEEIIKSIKDMAESLKYETDNLICNLPDEKEYLSRKEIMESISFCLNKITKSSTYDELVVLIDNLSNQKSLPPRPIIDEEIKEKISNMKKKVKTFCDSIKKICYKPSIDVISDLKTTYRYIEFLSKIVENLDSVYSLKKSDIYSVDFSDYEHMAIKALEDETIREKYRTKFSKIYVDEYQDTSILQEKIIEMISTETNVVFVGDVKQSIYGFRNAFPFLFTSKYLEYVYVNDVKDEDKKCKVILTENFRSRKEVIDSINCIFSKLMEIDFGGTDYGKKEELVYGGLYEEKEIQNYKTELHIVEKEEKIESENEYAEDFDQITEIKGIERESIFVANRIRNLVDDKFKIYDTKNKVYKDIEYKDIVILMKSVQNKANVVQEVLKSKGIPSYTDTKEGFFKSDEISIIYSFLKILDNPLDDIAILSVMYSPIGRFNLDDIYMIKSTCKERIHIYDILIKSLDIIKDIGLKNKIYDFIMLLDKFRLYTNTYSIGDVISHIYSETKIYDLIGIETEEELKKMNYNSFLSIAYEFEAKESKGLNQFIKYIDSISKNSKSSDSPKIIGENENVVRIMTIHKSKGLEFPVVILMDTASKYNLDEKKDLLQIDNTYLGFNVLNKEYRITYPSIISTNIKRKIEEDIIKEEIRLLYVAMTRAKEKLIIFGNVNNYEKYINDICDFSNDSKIPYSIKINIKNHLKVILYALLNSKEQSSNFDIYIEKNKDIKELLNDVNSIEKYKSKKSIDEIKNTISNNKEKINDSIKEIYPQDIIEYKYINATKTKQKYSVSELKKNIKEEYSISNIRELIPEALSKNINATTYGTIFHKVIEKLFTDKNVKEKLHDAQFVDNAINKEVLKISEEFRTGIVRRLKNDICGLLNTQFIDIVNDSEQIYTELEFVLKSDLSDINELKMSEPTLVQGVIDMYIKTQKINIIIDFKTDIVYNDEQLVNRYKYQLYMYKSAVEKIKSETVDKVYIYSTVLNKLIQI